MVVVAVAVEEQATPCETVVLDEAAVEKDSRMI